MGVRHTETSLIVWTGKVEQAEVKTERIEPVIPLFEADQFYDAGDKGCASGPMDEIAVLMLSMQAGQRLEIHASDPTVASDLSAWCRMTGHELVEQQNSHYLVRHK